MRKIEISTCIVALLIATCFSCFAQDSAATRQKLVSEYALTQPNGAQDDIVTAGAVLVLQKGNVVMAPVTSTNLCQNTYKDQKLTQNAICKADKVGKFMKRLPGMSGQTGGLDTRIFVPGEKIWVTKIDVKDDSVVLGLFTDAYKDASGNDVRYKADLKFQFPKGFTPTTEQVEKMVAEVVTVQPAENADAKAQPQAAPGNPKGQTPAPAPPQAATVEPPPPPIAPPPPPPADPKEIKLGQTPDQVVANFGQPDKMIKLGAKQIYVYKDMKVTFLSGKVSDVQ